MDMLTLGIGVFVGILLVSLLYIVISAVASSKVDRSDLDRIRGEIRQDMIETEEVNKMVSKIYRDIDSRFDKFENKLKTKSETTQLLKD